MSKKYTTNFLQDTNGDTGASNPGYVLTSSASGVDWAPTQGTITGSGTTSYIPMWTPDGTTLGNSVIFQTGTTRLDALVDILELSNDWAIQSTDGNYWQRIQTVDSSEMLSNPFSFDVRSGAGTSWVSLLVLQQDGNVGIGTTSPENKLHVQQSALYTGIQSTAGIRIKSDGASAIGNYHGTIALSRGTGSVAISAVQEDTDSDVMGMAFFTHPSATGGDAAVEKMRIDQNGNVGIGTTSPGAKLQVEGAVFVNGEGNGFMVESGTAATARTGFMKYGGLEGMIVSGNTTKIRLGHRTDSDYVFGASPTIREDLVITAAGNVAIGDTTTTYKLFVNGNSRFANSVYVDTNTGADGLWVTRLGGASEALKMYTTDTTSYLDVYQDENQSGYGNLAFRADDIGDKDGYLWFGHRSAGEAMRITNEGFVGINNNTPTFTLDVVGTARVTGNTEFVTQSTTDDSTKVATTAFVKNILAEQPAGLTFLGDWNAATNSPALASGGGELASGSSTSLATNKLIDSAASFASDGITAGTDRIRLVQANGNIEFVVISTVDSDTQLTLASNAVTATGETYIVEASPFLSPEGGYYIVTTTGTTDLNGISDWTAGDWVLIATNNAFQKIDNTSILSGQGVQDKIAKWATSSGDPSVTLASSSITDTGSAVTIDNPTTVQGILYLGHSNTSAQITGNTSGNLTIDNNTGQIAFQANGSTVNSLTITSSLITLNEVSQVNNTLQTVTAMGDTDTWNSAVLRLQSTNTVDTTGFQGMRFATSTADNYGWRIGANRSASGRGSLRFYEHALSVAGVERFTILQDGNVGIGADNPDAKLEINGGSTANTVKLLISGNDSIIKLGSTHASGPHGIQFDYENNVASDGMSMYYRTSPEYLAFEDSTGVSGNILMVIKRDGNVGIGADDPQEKLDVEGNIVMDAADARLKIKSGITGTNGGVDWTFNTASTQYARIDLDYDTRASVGLLIDSGYPITLDFSSGRFAIQNNGSEKMRINSNGNVGIGVTNPETSRLLVRGSTNDSTSQIFQAANLAGATKYVVRADGDNKWYKNDNSLSMVLSSIGDVGIGTTAPTSLLEISKQLSAVSTIDYPYTISSRDDGNSINQAGGEGVGIKFRIAGNAATTPGDSLVGASIAAIRESASDTDSSTGLGFFITQNDETLDEAMRITSASAISFGASGHGNSGQVLTSAGNASPTWTTPTTGTVTGSGAVNQVAFWDGANSLDGDGDLYWDATNDHLGIGDSSPGSRLKVFSGTGETSIYTVDINHVRNNADVSTTAMRINTDLSGADTTTADRTNYGLFVDTDSSANGDASNEHRIRGVGSFVNFTGFTDVAQGGIFSAESNYTGGKTASLTGVQGNAIHDTNSTSGGVSNMYGVYGSASIQDLGDVDNAFGGYFISTVSTNRGASNVGNMTGVVGEIQIDKPDTITYGTITAVLGIIDNNETTFPTFGAQYLFKGDYQGTRASNAYGVYCEGDRHYFEGKVGIGVTSPSEALEVNSGSIFVNGENNGVIVDSVSKRVGLMKYSGHEGVIARASTVDFGIIRCATSDIFDGSSLIYDLYVSGTGNVGIGTTGPAVPLDVEGKIRSTDSAAGDFVEVWNDGSQSGWSYITTSANELVLVPQSGGLILQGENSGVGNNASLQIYNALNTAVNVKLDSSGDSYLNGGDVGIGDTSPSNKLDVNGDIRATQYKLRGNATNPTNTAVTIYDQATVGLTFSAHSTEIRGWTGSAMARSAFITYNTATFAGTCTATNFILSSDETLKDNIKEIDTEHIDIEWKNFELKSEPGVKRSGVIAQELEKKHPEFVRTDDEGLKSVAYIDLLISKIAELEARLEKAGL